METKDQPDLTPDKKVEKTDSSMTVKENKVPEQEVNNEVHEKIEDIAIKDNVESTVEPEAVEKEPTSPTKDSEVVEIKEEEIPVVPKTKKPRKKAEESVVDTSKDEDEETATPKDKKKDSSKEKEIDNASVESAIIAEEKPDEIAKPETVADAFKDENEEIVAPESKKKVSIKEKETDDAPDKAATIAEEKPDDIEKPVTVLVKTEEAVIVEDKQVDLVGEATKVEKAEISHEDSSEILNEDSDDHDEEDNDTENDEKTEETIDYDTLTRLELVEILEPLVAESDINLIKKKVAVIKVAFLRQNKEAQEKKFETYVSEGGEEDDFVREIDSTEERYKAAFSIYSQNRKKWLEDQEKIKHQNLETKKLILEELKTLIESEESLKKTYDEFKELQDKWKQIGMVPKSEVNNLWQSYHFFVEKFFDKVKINKELRDLDMRKNLESKIDLCEKAEELLLENSILKSFKKLQDYHRLWKEVGPVPQDKRDELWERFRSSTDKINQRRRDHYNSLRDNQKNNFIAKTALCEKAEEILQIENESIKDWQNNTDKITELLKVWKTIGPAPRIDNDAIWERFKASLDAFFNSKKEYFQKIKDEQLNNYNLKLDLCAQAEAIKTSTDWRNTTNDLISLQKEWKQIGPAPKKHSDKVWKRFRAACDAFFEAKSEYFSNIKQHEGDNQAKKEELIKQVETFEFAGNKNKDLEVLKEFQREWTEIGHVPFKEKDRLQTEFRNAVNTQLDKLNISKFEMQKVNYKQRFEKIHDNPNAGRIINNERTFLVNKKKKLEEEVNLWENNMGFLAESKNASLLKLEFEKKIEKQKVEIEVINEKIRFLERGTE